MAPEFEASSRRRASCLAGRPVRRGCASLRFPVVPARDGGRGECGAEGAGGEGVGGAQAVFEFDGGDAALAKRVCGENRRRPFLPFASCIQRNKKQGCG